MSWTYRLTGPPLCSQHRLRVDMQGAITEDNVEEEKFSWTAVSLSRYRGTYVQLMKVAGSLCPTERQHAPHVLELLPHPHPDLLLLTLPAEHHRRPWLLRRDGTAFYRAAEFSRLSHGDCDILH
jgi:hypothetical protein